MKIEFEYSDIDSNMYTKAKAYLMMEVEAADYLAAYHLAEKLKGILQADSFVIHYED